jgi:hypothetical protein
MVPSVSASPQFSANPVASLAQKFLGHSYTTGAAHHANPVYVAAGTTPGSVELANQLAHKLTAEGVTGSGGSQPKLYVIA